MKSHLPEDKLQSTQQLFKEWLGKRNAITIKHEILSLVGVLQHAVKVVLLWRTFVSRMYATTAKVKELDYFTRLNKDFRSDLSWWHTFLTPGMDAATFNGIPMQPLPTLQLWLWNILGRAVVTMAMVSRMATS